MDSGSLLDGLGTAKEYVAAAVKHNQPAIAITDHGTLAGVHQLYSAVKDAQKEGHEIHAIAGLEAYFVPSIGTIDSKEPLFLGDGGRDDVSSRGAYTHLTLLAENAAGLRNLFRMSKIASLRGFYKKPRISLEVLAEHAEGIIVTTGCPSGEVQVNLRLGQYDKALAFAAKLVDIVGKDNVFVELMDHGMKQDLERKVRGELLRIAMELDLPIVATNDTHYATHDQAKTHEELLAIQTRAKMSEVPDYDGGTRFAFEGGGSYYVKSAAEMAQVFPDLPEALSNTLLIAERAKLEIDYNDVTLRPTIPVPEGHDQDSWLRKECYEGLAKRLPDKVNDEVYIARMEKELKVLKDKNFSSYFLVVSDMIRWAKFRAEPSIPMGPGRGSAAGSLVAFVLDITDADPIRFDLLFERFLNPERDSPPDVDIDIADRDRERLITYVRETYGDDQVAQVITYGTIGAKAAIKDVARIYEYPIPTSDALSKALPPPVFGKEIHLSDVYNPDAARYPEAEEFRELVKREHLEEIIEPSLKLEGRVRSHGKHAAAVIISNQNLADVIPIAVLKAGERPVAMWDYPTAEAMGLIKMDFLGLRNLTIMQDAVANIKKTKGIDIDIRELILGPMDDAKTYQMLQRGDSLGVFQLDGCLGGDTLISGRKISQLYNRHQAGKGISTTTSYDLAAGKARFNKVLNVVQSGIKPVFRIVSESGRLIEATTDHRFFTSNGWKKLGELDLAVDKLLVDQTVKTLFYRTCIDCGKQLAPDGRPSQRCYKHSATFHSNPSKSQSREVLAKAARQTYLDGRVVWNKGLDKEVHPSLAAMSRKSIAALAGRNVLLESLGKKKYAKLLAQQSEKMSGAGNPMFGRAPSHRKGGYRIDLGHYVRSSWEADYARVLNYLNVPYQYEPKTFDLKRADGSKLTYTPDFYLPSEQRYVEIKGYMRAIDAEKIELVKVQHGIDLRVIQKSEFAELQFTYKNLVDWECPKIPERAKWESITSIDALGEQMTYDISMEAPLNNFLANGFMVHNSGMRSLMKMLKPTDIEDISALVALYRPGPMGASAHTDYALRKNGLQEPVPIHPEFLEPLKDVLGTTYEIILYQEQIQRMAQIVAGYSLAEADLLRRAMGKKKRYIIDAEFATFKPRAIEHGYSEEAIQALWDVVVPFADYAFNKCLSDRTTLRLGNGMPIKAREVFNMHKRGEKIELQAMWPDGEIRPHTVENVVSTGVKQIARLKTASGRTVEATMDHRLLTTRGYQKLEDMRIGVDELIVADRISTPAMAARAAANIRKAHGKPLTQAQLVARSVNMVAVNSRPERVEQDLRAAKRMSEYQSTLTFAERSAHQKMVSATPDRTAKVVPAMLAGLYEKYENDAEFRQRMIEHLARVRYIAEGSGFGKKCFASNGMACDSLNERSMAEFLIEQNIKFDMHKFVGRGQCDFYFEGLYWEMDGMDRHPSYFERKYGDLPYVVVTPEDYKERISDVLKLDHARNGDLIVSIEILSRHRATIDIQMAEGGPKNFLTWKGIVSHNSHSLAYGLTAYATAYLKANYPTEYMAALLTSTSGNKDKTAEYLEDCRQHGIIVRQPDVNLSGVDYTPVRDNEIVFGFKAIKGVGDKPSQDLVAWREENGQFKSFEDYLMRAPKTALNKTVITALAESGGFDSFKITRRSILEQIESVVKALQKLNLKRKKHGDGLSLFDNFDELELTAREKTAMDALAEQIKVVPMQEYPKMEKLKIERERLGLYVSDHPLKGIDLAGLSNAKVSDLLPVRIDAAEEGEEDSFDPPIIRPVEGWPGPKTPKHQIAGILSSWAARTSKKGNKFGMGLVEDHTGSQIEITMFGKAFDTYGEFMKADSIYQFTGYSRYGMNGEDINFNVEAIRPLEFSDSGLMNVRIRLLERQFARAQKMFEQILSKYPPRVDDNGEVRSANIVVSLKDADTGGVREVTLDTVVEPGVALMQEIKGIFGRDIVGRWKKASAPAAPQYAEPETALAPPF